MVSLTLKVEPNVLCVICTHVFNCIRVLEKSLPTRRAEITMLGTTLEEKHQIIKTSFHTHPNL